MSGSTLTFEPGGALRSRLVAALIDADRATLDAGTAIGPFRILHAIGRGGLGVVYLAERADGAFEQQVALKLIAPEADPGVAEILLARERRLLARLQHANIARLLDGGRSERGLLWFAMDYVAGERIDRWCAAHGLDLRARVRLVREVVGAVAYAHARLVVHRDIKPSNILVDAAGVPRLLDFGIAAALDEANDDLARAATPSYASPEQNRGDPAGIAQDVYQLGRLLETLLDGLPVRERRADVAAIVARASAPQPQARYATADALAADLDALLDGRPVAARGGGTGHRAWLALRRHRVAAAASIAALLILVGTVAYFLWSLSHERARAEREAQTARRVSEFMVGLFRSADPALHEGRMPTVDAVLAGAPAQIERELAAEPAVMAELLTAIGRVHIALRDYAGAAAPLRRAVELSRGMPDVPVQSLAERLRALALAIDTTDRDAARALLREALSVLDADSPVHARTYNILQQNLAMAELSSGDRAAGVARLRDALAHGRRLLAEGQPARIADELGLGSALLDTGEHAEALEHYRTAFTSAREHLGVRHPYAILAAGGLAVSLARNGAHDEAARTIGEALDGALKVYGDAAPNYALALTQQAEVLTLAGDRAQAIAQLRLALEVCGRFAEGNDLLSVDVLEALGDNQLAIGDAAAAEASYREMLARNRGGKRAQQPDLGQRPLKLAQALAAQGRCEEAREQRQIARERAARVSPDAATAQALREPLAGCP